MQQFKLISDYKPAGDQPEAIKQLVDGINGGEQFQTLLGVTGSGKMFTTADARRSAVNDDLQPRAALQSRIIKSCRPHNRRFPTVNK